VEGRTGDIEISPKLARPSPTITLGKIQNHTISSTPPLISEGIALVTWQFLDCSGA